MQSTRFNGDHEFENGNANGKMWHRLWSFATPTPGLTRTPMTVHPTPFNFIDLGIVISQTVVFQCTL